MDYNLNSELFFQKLLRNKTFMTQIDVCILETQTLDIEKVPQLVLLIMNLLEENNAYNDLKNIKNVKHLLDIIYSYIKAYLNLKTIDYDAAEFKESFNIYTTVALMKIKFKKRGLFSCY